MKAFYLFFLISISLYAEEPWGKDIDLIYEKSFEKPTKQKSLSSSCIRFYQKYISVINGPRSSFDPTSSEYTRQAMLRYGFFTGFLMGCDRLMRENPEPWVYHTSPYRIDKKYDPIR